MLYIDDFSWLIENGYFSDSLTHASNTYTALLATKQTEFSEYLTSLNTLNSDLLIRQNQFTALQTDLQIIEDDLDILKNINYSNDVTYDSRYIDYSNKLGEIQSKNNEIATIQTNINSINTSIETFRNEISYETNFTPEQLKELSHFIYEESLTMNSINDEALLYEYAKKYSILKSNPIVELDLDLIDMFEIGEGNKIKCGNYAYIDVPELGYDYYQTRLIQLKHNPIQNSLSAVFSNNDKINSAYSRLTSEILKKAQQTSNTLDDNASDYKQYVTEKSKIVYQGDTIDAGLTGIKAGNNIINRRGFLGTDIGSFGAIQILDGQL